ncbi:MAG: transglycosylase SLT domain-containing protein [Silvanigrellaceae bacterium]|nr:transglycosylase SLT domain-containing protein [Silvanigrellaceae bacterium]
MQILKLLFIYIALIYSNLAYSEFFSTENKIDFSNYTVKPKVDILSKNKKLAIKKADTHSLKNKETILNKNLVYSSNKVSYQQFKEILLSHNFPDHSVDKMWCIAHHESKFNPLAYNYNRNKTFDVGLFQINQIWKRWCGMKDKELLDVKNNTRCALVVLKKQGFTAWVTYKKFCRGV